MGAGQMGEGGFNTLHSEQMMRHSLPGCLATSSWGAWDSRHHGAPFMHERRGCRRVPGTVKLCPAQSWW